MSIKEYRNQVLVLLTIFLIGMLSAARLGYLLADPPWEIIECAPEEIKGDLNGDGKVDIVDWSIMDARMFPPK